MIIIIIIIIILFIWFARICGLDVELQNCLQNPVLKNAHR